MATRDLKIERSVDSELVGIDLSYRKFIDPRRENPGIHSGDERRTNV